MLSVEGKGQSCCASAIATMAAIIMADAQCVLTEFSTGRSRGDEAIFYEYERIAL